MLTANNLPLKVWGKNKNRGQKLSTNALASLKSKNRIIILFENFYY